MQSQSGFTLIELMIVTAIVSVVAGVAVPNLLSSRAVANERAVVASLRTIATAQTQCQTRAISDRDGDGQGEAIGLDQMAGLRPLADGTTTITPPVLPPSLGTTNVAGIAQSRGYLMVLYLPDAAGAAVVANATNEGSVAADQAEIAWSCLAWPLTRGRTGIATYFVNQAGEILVAKNATYAGTTSVPPGGAALTGVGPGELVGGTLAVGVLGADGNVWQTLR